MINKILYTEYNTDGKHKKMINIYHLSSNITNVLDNKQFNINKLNIIKYFWLTKFINKYKLNNLYIYSTIFNGIHLLLFLLKTHKHFFFSSIFSLQYVDILKLGI